MLHIFSSYMVIKNHCRSYGQYRQVKENNKTIFTSYILYTHTTHIHLYIIYNTRYYSVCTFWFKLTYLYVIHLQKYDFLNCINIYKISSFLILEFLCDFQIVLFLRKCHDKIFRKHVFCFY